LGVTSVFQDTAAKARMAAKLPDSFGRAGVKVYAGIENPSACAFSFKTSLLFP
jgi:hypothetical protein